MLDAVTVISLVPRRTAACTHNGTGFSVSMLEELIESAERRRKQALGMIEIYRASLATQLRAISLGEMIKGEKQNIPLVPNLK